tara:strand:+ start:201 stop:506 length:306 start_codon:yes stop_codon:yes gene_type:complete
MTNKELVKAFIQECIGVQNNKAKFKSNHIEMNDYFKDSGEVEEEKELISKWKYNENNKCNQIHEYYEEKQAEKSKTKRSCKQLGEVKFSRHDHSWDGLRKV